MKLQEFLTQFNLFFKKIKLSKYVRYNKEHKFHEYTCCLEKEATNQMKIDEIEEFLDYEVTGIKAEKYGTLVFYIKAPQESAEGK